MEIKMLHWSLIGFGLAASVGLYMLTRFYRSLPRQNSAMLLHGAFAATGISLLFYASVFEENSNVPYLSVLCFIVAVLGGITMAMWDKVMNRKLPAYLPLLHAGAAIAGVISLIVHVLNHQQG